MPATALSIGILHRDTFPDLEAATSAVIAWGLGANARGRELRALATLINNAGDIGVSVTLATREYWRAACRATNQDQAEFMTELASPDARDALRVVVAHPNGANSFALSLAEMKEAHNGRQ